MLKFFEVFIKQNKSRKNQYSNITTTMAMKKTGRFKGLTEEEVKKKDNLPDYLEPNLDIVVVGINPSLMAAYHGRYYAGPGNHFYKLLHAAELVPQFVSFDGDHELLKYKIGLTNIVDRATRSSSDLTSAEIKEGCNKVVEKLKLYKPKIAVFNGKCIYQVYAQQFGKTNFNFGLQLEKIGVTAVWVVPSSSARCSSFPRMDDKLIFYQGIKQHLQYLKGEDKDVDINQFYSIECKKTADKKVSVKKQKKINMNVKEYPQYVITEILDGSQKNKSDEGNESDDDDKVEVKLIEGQDALILDKYSAGSSPDPVKQSQYEDTEEAGTNDVDKSGVTKNLKRNYDDTAIRRSQKIAVTTHDKVNEVNFRSSIKQRHLEKNEASEDAEKTNNVKKLNFSNLEKNLTFIKSNK